MNGRTLYVPTLAALGLGMTMGLLGLFDDGGAITRAGILLSLATIPSLCYWQAQRAHLDVQGQIADAHARGYRLALEHVARGLLKPHTAPTGGGDRADQATNNRAADRTPDNVRPLRLIKEDPDERNVV